MQASAFCGSIETPAALVIRLLGVKVIAEACGLSTWAVYRWPATTLGHIPHKYQPTIYELARQRGLPLTAEEIIGVARGA